ncbi:molybdate transport system substrate-binding protein [Microbacterium marinum]|uniref:Molybdate transport system substrate-binding protein n=1 Tax=Microbacterium marinum TaxID=421115 RepID=A0A7W7FHU6_9MICO|nr:substrate-binding domain-containing protein [Microbacterium marinum]MBB4665690.1 molybdate transport system substrate-binding protein [Microbacterium marinum]
MATRHLLAELLPDDTVESMGGVDAEKRVARGEAWDVVVLASGALQRLAADGHVGPATPFVLSQTGVAVPADGVGERPSGAAYDSVADLQDALRAARRIGYSTGPSGTALVSMIERWGITDAVGQLVQARPGVPVAAALAAGEVDLGFQQLSELVGQPGIRILGVMPEGATIDTVFAAAVATASPSPARAAEVVAQLASDAVAPIKQRHAFGVPHD